MKLELPPRARRIHFQHNQPGTASGTTSACAENTSGSGATSGHPRNYLRVRGEYKRSIKPSRARWELPPRARRIHAQIPFR